MAWNTHSAPTGRIKIVTALVSILISLIAGWLWLPARGLAKAQSANTLVVLSAASFTANTPVAPDSIAVAFSLGPTLATTNRTATVTPLPTNLEGTTVLVNNRPAGLFFVGPTQVNFLIPAATEPGTAQVVIRSGSGVTATGTVQVRAVAPALFTANANGTGLPAAVILRVRGTSQTFEALARFDTTQGRFTPVPIELGPSTDRVFLILYGTGFRGRTAQNEVTTRIGNLAASVLAVSKAGEGLDQINIEIPRTLNGSGTVKVLVAVTGASAANETEIVIAQSCASSEVQVSSLSTSTLAAGQELIINGANFSATATENVVRIVGDETQPEAQILEATPTRLRVLVPFGASPGQLSVSTLRGTGCFSPVTIQTSVSGYVQDGNRQPIRDVTIRYLEANKVVQTNAEGAFVLRDVPVSNAATLEIDGTTVASSLPYPKRQFKMRVRANRDNQVNGYIELKQATGSSIVVSAASAGEQTLSTLAEWPASASAPDGQIQTGQVILDIPNNATVRFLDGVTTGTLTLTVLESGRTPGTLPSGQFSPVIAQITPFGATITPGAKLTFPNPDGYAPNTKLKLFRYDQRQTVNNQPNPTLGQFIEVGTDAATVSADGQRIETAINAVTETSYYFASAVRPTVTLIGRVVENNLNRTPVRRSLVNARGQGIFTDGNGGFVIRNVPVNASAAAVAQLGGEITLEPGATEVVIADDRVGVEADFMRPSTKVDRSQQENVPPVVNTVTLTPDLVLNSNRAPVITAPASTTANAGTPKDVGFLVSDPDAGQTVQVTVEGASFATVIKGSGDNFTLRLTPGANDGGNYNLVLTATDGRGGTTTKEVKLRVNGLGPLANEQVISVNRNSAKAITLTGSDPQKRTLTFILTSFPSHGTLTGTLPNVTYTPTRDYTGADNFGFKLRAGQAESDEAIVTLNVQQANTPPTLVIPQDQFANAGEAIIFTVIATDQEAGQSLKFEIDGKPPGAILVENLNSIRFSWTPSFTQTGTYELVFKVTDNGTPPLADTKKVKIRIDAKWGKTSGPESGRPVTAFTSNNGNLFAGINGSGVFRSSDNGRSWLLVNDGLTDRDIITLTSASFSIYAGTARRMFRSDDQGRNWTQLNSDFLQQNITILAASGTMVFLGTEKSFFRSNDLGGHWEQINAGLPQTVLVVAIVALGANIFIASAADGIFILAAATNKWVPVNSGLPNLNTLSLCVNGNSLIASIDGHGLYFLANNAVSWVPGGLTSRVTALAANGTKIYATIENQGVYLSNDNGRNWIPVNSGLTSTQVNMHVMMINGAELLSGTANGILLFSENGRGWSVSKFGLSGIQINALLSSGNRIIAGTEEGVYISNTNGQSWIKTGTSLPSVKVRALLLDGGSVYAGTCGGVFRSIDQGQNWSSIYRLPDADCVSALRVISEVLFVVIPGKLIRSSDQGKTWSTIQLLLLGNPEITSIVKYNEKMYVGTKTNGVFRSGDFGLTWEEVKNGLPIISVFGNRAYDINSLVVQGGTLFAGTGLGVFKLNEKDLKWVLASGGLSTQEDSERIFYDSVLLLDVGSSGLYATVAGTTTLNRILFTSKDEGQTWAPVHYLGAPVDSYHIRALIAVKDGLLGGNINGVYFFAQIAQSWAETNSGLVVADSYSLSSNNQTLLVSSSAGVYRSVNQGQNWTRSNTFQGGLIRNFVSYRDEWLGATDYGLSVSQDDGVSWINTPLFMNEYYDFVTHKEKIYASGRQGVYRIEKQAGNWVINTVFFKPQSRLALVSKGEFLYASRDIGGIYRSDKNGENWVTLGTDERFLPGFTSLATLGDKLFGYGDGSGVLMSEDDGKTWRSAGLGLEKQRVTHLLVKDGKIYGATYEGVFVSPDNGKNWQPVRTDLPYTVNKLAFTQADLFAATSAGGVLKLSDNIQSFRQSNDGLPKLAQFLNTIINTNGVMFIGTFGSGIFLSGNFGQTWASANGQGNNQLPPVSNIQSLVTNGIGIWAASFGDGVYRSTNQGTSWTAVNSGLNNKAVNRLFLNGPTLYAGTEGGVYRSTNNGDTWTLISAGMGTLPVDSFTVLNGTVYAGTDGNGVYRLNADGVSWTRKSNGLTSQQVRSLGVNGNLLYAGTIGGGICLSRDGSETWTAVNNQLPPTLNVFAFAVSGKKVYAGSIYGVFFTEDEGQNWKQINAGLLNTYVTGLAVSGEQLFASTASGGVFVSRIPQ